MVGLRDYMVVMQEIVSTVILCFGELGFSRGKLYSDVARISQHLNRARTPRKIKRSLKRSKDKPSMGSRKPKQDA